MTKKYIDLIKPAVLNHLIIPIVGLVNSVWVSKLDNSNMLAGQGYGDQVFIMVYYIFYFLPTILAPKISTLFTQNKKENIIEIINISIILSLSIDTMLSIVLFNYSDFIVQIFVSNKANIRIYTIEFSSISVIDSLQSELFSSLFKYILSLLLSKYLIFETSESQTLLSFVKISIDVSILI